MFLSSKINYLLKKRVKKENTEHGRTMVEILGVLTIVGILSIGGFYAYKTAFYIAKENQTLDIINKTTAAALTGFLYNEINSESTNSLEQIAASQVNSNTPVDTQGNIITPLETKVSAWTANGTVDYTTSNAKKTTTGRFIEIRLQNITYNLCKRLLTENNEYQNAYLPIKMYLGVNQASSDEDKEAFCANMVDTFKRSSIKQMPQLNPDANMILCYAEDPSNCGLATKMDHSCNYPFGSFAHNQKVRDCGICKNGGIIEDNTASIPECKKCNIYTNFFNQDISGCTITASTSTAQTAVEATTTLADAKMAMSAEESSQSLNKTNTDDNDDDGDDDSDTDDNSIDDRGENVDEDSAGNSDDENVDESTSIDISFINEMKQVLTKKDLDKLLATDIETVESGKEFLEKLIIVLKDIRQIAVETVQLSENLTSENIKKIEGLRKKYDTKTMNLLNILGLTDIIQVKERTPVILHKTSFINVFKELFGVKVATASIAGTAIGCTPVGLFDLGISAGLMTTGNGDKVKYCTASGLADTIVDACGLGDVNNLDQTVMNSITKGMINAIGGGSTPPPCCDDKDRDCRGVCYGNTPQEKCDCEKAGGIWYGEKCCKSGDRQACCTADGREWINGVCCDKFNEGCKCNAQGGYYVRNTGECCTANKKECRCRALEGTLIDGKCCLNERVNGEECCPDGTRPSNGHCCPMGSTWCDDC